MTPKEKAEKLVKKYSKWEDDTGCGWNIECAKECALIAVDEVLNFMEKDDIKTETLYWTNSPELTYWYNVKREIEKLTKH